MRQLLAVAAGGVVGTGLRLLVDALSPLPWATLAVNVVGAFALGLLVARVWPRVPAWTRAGLGAGLLGSFTTFSAVAVLVVTLPLGWAIAYAAANVVLGLAAAFLGLRLGGRSVPPIDPVTE
jgi:CrcB protein